jgi:uncharacterized protein (DUF305 family)
MYVLMYAMVNVLANVIPNINQAYMAGLMTAPMVIFELLLMRSMYEDRRRNIAILAASGVTLVGCWIGIREQVAISNRQFLESMIPHHAGAILMCQQASLTQPEIKELCRTIIAGQQSEIDQMKELLGRS